jgi:hypothetical protein
MAVGTFSGRRGWNVRYIFGGKSHAQGGHRGKYPNGHRLRPSTAAFPPLPVARVPSVQPGSLPIRTLSCDPKAFLRAALIRYLDGWAPVLASDEVGENVDTKIEVDRGTDHLLGESLDGGCRH